MGKTIAIVTAARAAPTGAVPFTDVDSGGWYAAAILWASQNKVVYGYGGGRFGPEDPITREQLVAMLMRDLLGVAVK